MLHCNGVTIYKVKERITLYKVKERITIWWDYTELLIMQDKDKSGKNWTSSTETTETMKMNRKLMKQTVTRSNKHLQEIFYRHNLPETAETSVTNETGLKNWTSSTETTETIQTNRNLMKQTVTRSNKHLQEIFYRHNLPETAETSVTNETGLKKLDIFH